MNTRERIIAAVASFLLILGFFMLIAPAVRSVSAPVGEIGTATSTGPTLSHAQEVWKGALEWCESQGVVSAVNPKDRDNTPSYGGFQFKPETLDYFAGIYGIATSSDGVMSYPVQSAVVDAMILDRGSIDWAHQFPVCVSRLGAPPA